MAMHATRVGRLAVMMLLMLATALSGSAGAQRVAHWVLGEEDFSGSTVPDKVGGYPVEVHGTVTFASEPFEAVQLDGQGAYLSMDEPPRGLLPGSTLSAEAWVSLNVGQSWGTLVSYAQDNGAYEKGWILGYNSTRFNFSVSTSGDLQYMASQTEFRPGQWYHVVGTYDGAALRLYVNGKLESSQALSGAIDYPDNAVLSIGAYKDDDEFFPMNGALHEVAIYDEAASEAEIVARYEAKAPAESGGPLELALPPYVQYVSPSEAVVRWWTTEACPSILEYGPAGPGAKHAPRIRLFGQHQGHLETRVEDPEPKQRHEMRIENLRPNAVYAYRIKAVQRGAERATDVFELDTSLNYAVRPMPVDLQLGSEGVQALAEDILNHTGLTKGYCLVWGLVDGSLAYELAARSDLTVLGLDQNADRVAAIRRRLYEAGVYGGRISVQAVKSLAETPYPSNFANLIVSERMFRENTCPGAAAELARVLRRRQGAAVLASPAKSADRIAAIEAWLAEASLAVGRREVPSAHLHTVTKAVAEGIGSWTHQYGDAGNTADSHEELSGVTATNQLQVQWLGKPGADFGLDRNPRMPAPLAAGGRLFHQGMNRMVALDAYNGAILWSLEIPAMRRVNLPRDASNWCTDEAFLYTAVQDKCWMIEHYCGTLEHAFALPEAFPAGSYDWGYLARQDETLVGSAVRKNTVYTEFWGGESWYDKTQGAGTGKVCSDALFAYNVEDKSPAWMWQNGLIVNTTIAVDEKSIVFVESRNEALKAAQSRRLNDSRLWSDQYLVALDPKTGQRQWERPLDTADGIVVFFLAYRDDSIVITSSAAGKYHLYAFDANDGQSLWHAQHNWPSDNHGGHMQHPVMLADRVFLEPRGYNLKTGERLAETMSGREGCATYCGTKHALIHRGQARRLTMWDFNAGKISSWHNLRPSCWLSTVAGEGMVLSPEGGGGCSCGNWLETSLAFAPIEN